MQENYNNYLDNLNLDKLTSRLKLGGGEAKHQWPKFQYISLSFYIATVKKKKTTEINLDTLIG